MDLFREVRSYFTRRDMLKSAALTMLPLAIPKLHGALEQQELRSANGGTDPFPIPWLDKNGSHNQPAGANLEPSHIYHFKGRVARCSTFTGMSMTDALPGTGGTRKSDPRFSPAYRDVRPLLGRSRSRARPDHQCGWQHVRA